MMRLLRRFIANESDILRLVGESRCNAPPRFELRNIRGSRWMRVADHFIRGVSTLGCAVEHRLFLFALSSIWFHRGHTDDYRTEILLFVY